jgi:hypothetical protein
VPALVFTLAGLRFLTTGTYELGEGEIWEDASGLVGCALALLALYAAFAAELEEALHRSVLPLGRRRDAKTALDGSLFEQIREIGNAPGVRSSERRQPWTPEPAARPSDRQSRRAGNGVPDAGHETASVPRSIWCLLSSTSGKPRYSRR